METIDVDIDEVNEIGFKLKIDGAASGQVSARLYCESDDGMMHAFTGTWKGEPETVTFRLPQMTRLVSEGVYPAWIEVLIDNKQFVPARFDLKFRKPVSVKVESVVLENSQSANKGPSVTVESSAIVKPRQESSSFEIKPKTLREKFETKRTGTGTGISESVMNDVTKSVVSRLTSKGSGDRNSR